MIQADALWTMVNEQRKLLTTLIFNYTTNVEPGNINHNLSGNIKSRTFFTISF